MVPPRRVVFACVLLLTLATVPAGRAQAPAPDWIEVDYSALVNRRELSHSGESVGVLLDRLDGRPLPPPGKSSADRMEFALLDPLLEPYAFILPDALDASRSAPDPPMVEVGSLWDPGQAQAAWVELLRARRYVVESDGRGRLRLELPLDESGNSPTVPSGDAARRAYDRAWPVLRHVFAAERRRLAALGAGDVPLRVEVRAYVHDRSRTRFLLGSESWSAQVVDTRSEGRQPPLDLDALQGFLDTGLRLEGGKLEPDGTLRLFGSRETSATTLLGRPVALSDLAVAYRAIFHGGLSEPYMSLDRGYEPQTSLVNYGGRLRDTDLGRVSLLCDVRFKTFSLGIDIASGIDVRDQVRRSVPGFLTHLERFSADEGSAGIQAQQTRLWFYPDDVDLTVSPQSDLLAMRRVRMSAASERVQATTMTAVAGEDPPWTRATVDAINHDYDRLSALFPELADLDQVVRLLSLFTWLRQAQADGLAVPDLDVLLAIELPRAFTPRRFPQLLTFDALPPAGGTGAVVALDRVPVGQALERLRPRGDRLLGARLRFERAAAGLDRANEQEAALLAEFATYDVDGLTPSALDLLAYRAERLRMHRLVLSTLDRNRAEALMERQRAGEQLRIFSVGIGGLDLGMDRVLARASGNSLRFGSETPPPTRSSVAPSPSTPVEPPAAREQWRRESPADAAELPDHGLGAAASKETVAVRFGDNRLEKGTTPTTGADGRPARQTWVLAIMGVHDPEVRSRKSYLDERGRATEFERVERERFLHYRVAPEGGGLRAEVVPGEVEPPAAAASSGAGPAPPSLVRLFVEPGPAQDSPTITLRLESQQDGTPRQLVADFPRSMLQRLVEGREVDPAPSQPLPLAPLPPSLGRVDAVLFQLGAVERARPWESSAPPVPGEADPVRLARALNRWSRQGPPEQAAPPAVVGVEPSTAVGHWNEAPRAAGGALLLLPADGWLPGSAALHDALASSWTAGPVVGELPREVATTLVVVVSDEPPGVCASRLRDLSLTPALRGKLLAGWCLAGELRPDVPAQLVADGHLAGLGIAASSIVDLRHAAPTLAELSDALDDPSRANVRVETLPGPFLWFF